MVERPVAMAEGRTSSLWAVFEAIRPKQWTKNLFVFPALVFSRNALKADMLERSLLAFGAFCALSGVVYLMNDLRDVEQDRAHPVKSRRPLASGRLSRTAAIAAAMVLLVSTGALSLLISQRFALVALAYLALQAAYTTLLKRVVLVDVIAIAAGFVLRAVAGAVAIDVWISSWLLICASFLALFLGFCKRRYEIGLLKDKATDYRAVLGSYSTQLLDQIISLTGAATVLAYALYTMADETQKRFGGAALELTNPFVVYGILRYLYLTHQTEGGEPDRLLFDRALMLNALLFGAVVFVILYVG
jgi:4-hydroxybenzoate polyprenyltransferase